MAETLDRRALIAAFLAASALTVPAGRAFAMPAPGLETRLARLGAADRGSARRVGKAYLATGPQERDVGEIHKALARRLGADAASLDDQALAARVDHAVSDDFARYQTVELHGWVMSKTELQLCALVALGY